MNLVGGQVIQRLGKPGPQNDEDGMIQKTFFKRPLFLLLGFVIIFSPAGIQAQEAAAPPQTAAGEAGSSEEVSDIIRRARETDRPLTPQEAFKVLSDEALKGNGQAMLNLGVLYERGYGVARHMGQALFWYQKAADKGLPQGYYNLGVAHEIGLGTVPDMPKAVAGYRRASRAGLPQADYKLANLYYRGEGVEKNQPKALEYLIKAAEAGHIQANMDLGGIYYKGLWEQPRDLAKAAAHIKTAAEAGWPEAMKDMAVLYRNGEGVSVDFYEAAKWYRLAQMAGYTDLDEAIKEVSAQLSEEQNKRLPEAVKKWTDDYKQKKGPEAASAN